MTVQIEGVVIPQTAMTVEIEGVVIPDRGRLGSAEGGSNALGVGSSDVNRGTDTTGKARRFMGGQVPLIGSSGGAHRRQ
jgi:hypothetical protein